MRHVAPRKGFYRCRPVRLARMNRFGTKKVGTLESFRVWSHRLRGRAVRYVHHDEATGRSHRANFFKARALKLR